MNRLLPKTDGVCTCFPEVDVDPASAVHAPEVADALVASAKLLFDSDHFINPVAANKVDFWEISFPSGEYDKIYVEKNRKILNNISLSNIIKNSI